MLRVEASNLTNPRGLPRPRRLLPLPPGTRRRAASYTAQREMLPPPDEATQVTQVKEMRPALRSHHDNELWSVKLELGNEEIARLYGQGMARGAAVWRKGMIEWRPLLITPEFSDLLRRTRLTPPPPPSVPAPMAAPPEPLTLPRPARLPYSVMPPELIDGPVPISTMAPMAADIELPPQTRARRPMELAAVGVAAFALAWVGHAALSGGGDSTQAALAAASQPLAAAPQVCEPTAAASPASVTAAARPGIRTVSVADLPVASRGGAAAATHAAVAPTHVSSSRAARSVPSPSVPAASAPMPSAPSRSDLVGAMSQVARASSSCGERGGPVRVVVTFSGSGVARSIQVSGADLPAGTRSCIIAATSRARVGAFSGEPVTVSKAL